MTPINYRATLERFGHIDSEFVRASASFTPERGTAEVVVRFYPWWEHPLYVAARERGYQWGFSSYEEGMREVVVTAVRPFAARLSARQNVIDGLVAMRMPYVARDDLIPYVYGRDRSLGSPRTSRWRCQISYTIHLGSSRQ